MVVFCCQSPAVVGCHFVLGWCMQNQWGHTLVHCEQWGNECMCVPCVVLSGWWCVIASHMHVVVVCCKSHVAVGCHVVHQHANQMWSHHGASCKPLAGECMCVAGAMLFGW